uniref:Small ribosomal subunit protein uS4c n=1 Tax=Pedinomonas tuberculata TaxID=160064 RepID=A0A097KL73_9CHLO|nr:ribosomal protein S4 [Pedinomonas tuberculata]AIT93939.1 ribosomal protein S4 [Pedinomonas tuberculata]
MARYSGPRLRIIRRLGELPGLTKKALTRINPPGQHGATKKKNSQYGIRLLEKQKLRYNYGISEAQLIRYVKEARKAKGSTGEILLQKLEMRLDNIIYRLGFAPTILAARQLVSHGHILVNNTRVTIPSYPCTIKEVITVRNRPHSKNLVTNFLTANTTNRIPSHLSFNKETFSAVLQQIANRTTVPFQINELLVVEFYSRKL